MNFDWKTFLVTFFLALGIGQFLFETGPWFVKAVWRQLKTLWAWLGAWRRGRGEAYPLKPNLQRQIDGLRISIAQLQGKDQLIDDETFLADANRTAQIQALAKNAIRPLVDKAISESEKKMVVWAESHFIRKPQPSMQPTQTEPSDDYKEDDYELQGLFNQPALQELPRDWKVVLDEPVSQSKPKPAKVPGPGKRRDGK
jgi:hypothetical protein